VPALKGKYDVASGTSMAAAFVSGVVALLLERDAQLDAEEIRTILSSSARKPDKPLGKEAVGAGILDAAGALGTPGTEEAVVSPPAATEVSGER
jgi:subtilisin family serine protease